jgi:ABC-type arginine/histidine transport system permease subunit
MIKTTTNKIILPDTVYFSRDPYSNEGILKFKMPTLKNRDVFCGQAYILL